MRNMATELGILAELLAELPSRAGYSPTDRYRDFRKVFGTDEGKRVLGEIIDWGRLLRSPLLGNPIDSHAMAIAFGERNMALKLMAAVYTEPLDKPQRSNRVKP